MFNDRDLILMGLGALVAIFCLFLPLPFWLKAVLGGAILVGAMVLALLRVGPDRIPLETWLRRRLRYKWLPKFYTYYRRSPKKAAQSSRAESTAIPVDPTPGTAFRPLDLVWAEVGVYNLIRIWLAMIGVYVVYWIANGGGEELAWILKNLGF